MTRSLRCKAALRRRLAALAAGVALLFALTFGAAAATKLTLLGIFPGDQAGQMQEFLNQWGGPRGVEVELVLATSWPELADRAITMTAAGVGPDLIFSDQLRMHQLRGAGIVQPLDAWMERDGVGDGIFPPALLAVMQFGGSTYALPTNASLFNIYYNASRFQERGLEAIPADWNSPGWNWDDFVATLQRLTYDTSGDGTPDHWGTPSLGTFGVNMIGLWGLHWVNEDRTRFVGTDSEVIEAMTRIWSLWTEHGVIGGNFLNGTAGMQVVQTQFLATLATQAQDLFEWSIGVLPRGTTRAGNQVGVVGFYMNAASPNKDVAWELLRYLGTTGEAGTRLFEITNRMPIQADAAARWAADWEARIPGLPIWSVIQGFDYVWDWWAINGASAGDHIALMNEMGQRVVRGELSPRQAIEQYAPRFQALLDSERQ